MTSLLLLRFMNFAAQSGQSAIRGVVIVLCIEGEDALPLLFPENAEKNVRTILGILQMGSDGDG